MSPPRLTGLVAATYTAFHADGSLNLDLIKKQAESLVRNKVTGVFVCGTTGEGLSMTNSERMQVAKRWVDAAGSRLRVVVHVGHVCLADARALAAHAQQIGAAGIGCLAPCFFKPPGLSELVDYCAQVAGAAPALPFYYYHIPSMTGVNIPVLDFLRAASSRIPNLAGAKFTYENLMDYSLCLRLEGGQYDMVFGRDEILLPALVVGCRGAIGTTYNFAAPIYHRVMEAFARGDLAAAQKAQTQAAEMIQVMIRHGGLSAGKAIMGVIGLDCGPVRLPLRDLTADQRRQLRTDLEALGFFDWIK